MKKQIYLIVSAMLLTLYSCNNDTDVINSSVNKTENLDDAIIIDTEEKFMSMFPEAEPSNIESLKSDEVSTRGIQSITTTGYTSYTSNGVQKIFFNTENAAIFGLPAGTYFVEFCLVKKEVTIPSGYYPVILSGNGWNPDGKNQELGYSASLIGNKYTMTSKATCVRYNTIGQTFNIWRPVSSLSDLSWTYGIIN